MPTEYPVFFCPHCRQDTEHSIVKEDGHRLLVKCHNCGTLHDAEREPEPKFFPINLIYTVDGSTRNEEKSFPNSDRYLIGSFLSLDIDDKELHLEITSMENQNGSQVENAKIENIRTIWAKPVERIGFEVFILDGKKTTRLNIIFYAQEDFVIGKTYQTNQDIYKVTHIELKDGTMINEGSVSVGKIKRAFAVKADR